MSNLDIESDYEAGWRAGYQAGFIRGQMSPMDLWETYGPAPQMMARLPERPSR